MDGRAGKAWVARCGGEDAAGREENAKGLVSRRKMAVGLQDCGAAVDDVMRDGVGGEACTRTNAAGFDAWYGGPKSARCRLMIPPRWRAYCVLLEDVAAAA